MIELTFFAALLVPCIIGKPLPGNLPLSRNETTFSLVPGSTCGVNKYGQRIAPELYIVGGTTATPNFYPWQVSLQINGKHACGGSILNKYYILTASHCFAEATMPYSWSVVAGKHSLGKIETTQKTYYVEQIIKHEYFSATASMLNDIALMRLATPITFTDEIQPICLPAEDYPLSGSATITGWGATSNGGFSANYLQQVDVPFIDRDTCQARYPKEYIGVNMVCAGYDGIGGKDACQGDSGGPMVKKYGSQWAQVGVISWGYGCASPYYPAVYSRVGGYLGWIKQNIH